MLLPVADPFSLVLQNCPNKDNNAHFDFAKALFNLLHQLTDTHDLPAPRKAKLRQAGSRLTIHEGHG